MAVCLALPPSQITYHDKPKNKPALLILIPFFENYSYYSIELELLLEFVKYRDDFFQLFELISAIFL
jgi:hypothetical protein